MSVVQDPVTDPDTVNMTWEGGDESKPYRVEVSLFGGNALSFTNCGIFHESIATVTTEALPVHWENGMSGAKLPCGHTFHASSLALHFLTHNMTCPVCRRGNDTVKMTCHSLPSSVREGFENYLAAFHSRNPPETPERRISRAQFIDTEAMQQQFNLHVQLQGHSNNATTWQRIIDPLIGSELTLSSRLLGLEHGPPDDTTSLVPSTVQHNFRRRLESVRFGLGPFDLPRMHLVITHPCIATGIYCEGNHHVSLKNVCAPCRPGQSVHQKLTMRTPSGVFAGEISFDVTLHEHLLQGRPNQFLSVANFSVRLHVDNLMQVCMAQLEDVINTISGGILNSVVASNLVVAFDEV